MLTRSFPLSNIHENLSEDQLTIIINGKRTPIRNTMPYVSVDEYSQSSNDYSADEMDRDASVSYSSFRPTIMTPIVSLNEDGTTADAGELQCPVFLGFRNSENVICSDREQQSVNEVNVPNIAAADSIVSVEAEEVISSEEREESNSPSLIQHESITEMGFAADDEAVFINNKSINLLEQMRKEFKSVLSINLDDTASDVTPGSD